MSQGAFIWTELQTRDVAGSKAFYESTLGWTTETMDTGAGPYTLWKSGDRAVGGMMEMVGDQFAGVPNHWMAYVEVPDVDAVAGNVEAAGGKLLAKPFAVPSVGRIAVILDPFGAVVGVMTPEPPEE